MGNCVQPQSQKQESSGLKTSKSKQKSSTSSTTDNNRELKAQSKPAVNQMNAAPSNQSPTPSLPPHDDENLRSAMVRAASKIQRQARKNRAMNIAREEQQWKLFADLDTQDEAEMLHVAVFMQTLIDTVPGAPKTDQNGLKTQLESDEGGALSTAVDEQDIFICLDNITMAKGTNSNANEKEVFDIGNTEITRDVAAEIVEVFRRGGKLSRASVVKILRRAYKILLKQSNISRLRISETSKLTVVGDLHGQLADLLHILDETGLPNQENKFIFNGDFVDRGERGLEVVCILFALYVSEGPEVVCLNRGNHEDLAVCRVYGFEREVKSKYDDLIFEMFAEVFNHLPLFAIANDNIFVVHGGLFHNPDVSLQDLEEINRADYFVKPPIPYPQNTEGLTPAEARQEYLKQLQRDALWSDPTDKMGCFLNPRGAGVSFGPDIAQQFMNRHNYCMVIRSHECVFRGFDLPYLNNFVDNPLDYLDPSLYHAKEVQKTFNQTPLLCTLFSASNYIGGDNEGAILQFAIHPFPNSRPTPRNPNIHFIVKRYKTSQTDIGTRVSSTQTSLSELILKKKSALSSAFEAKDTNSSGQVSRVEWAEVMQRVTMIKIRWLSLLSSIAPADAVTPTSVHYKIFLSHFSVDKKVEGERGAVMDDMYGQRKRLEQIFLFFDTNGDGVISLQEFRDGCALLNQSLHADSQLTDIDRALQVMDFDGSGSIDINEFFETFRILDAKDGSVDGVISLAKK